MTSRPRSAGANSGATGGGTQPRIFKEQAFIQPQVPLPLLLTLNLAQVRRKPARGAPDSEITDRI